MRALVETISASGHEVHLLVYPLGEEISLPGVKIHRSWPIPGIKEVPVGASWRKILLDIPLALSALALSLRHRFAVFHGIEEGGFVAGTLGLLFRKPYIYDMDSCMVDQLRTGKFQKRSWLISLIEKLEHFFLRRAKAILTVATPLTQKAQSIAPHVPVFQIEDFPMDCANEVDEQLVKSLQRSICKENKRALLYTGNFEYYQGVELGLQAWGKACEGSPTFSEQSVFILVGGTGEQIESLRALSRSLKIESSVHFAGPRPPEEMGSFQAIAHALLSPRIVGGNTPLKLFTYMASGVPIAATKISSHTHVLNEDSAFLAEPTPESLALAISEALTHDTREQKAERARQLVNTRYSKKSFQEKLCALYDMLIPREAPQSETIRPEPLHTEGALSKGRAEVSPPIG